MATQGKILVAFFSWSGNCRTLAEQIAAATGGDLFAIKPLKPYGETYEKCVAEAKAERSQNARPALAETLDHLDKYDTVFLGWPCWCHTLPQPVFTFLASGDFRGKKIYPFSAQGGSGWGAGLADLEKLAPRATIGEGLLITAHSDRPDTPSLKKSTPEAAAWLKKIGFGK